jgi:hypothetical protein
MWSFKRWRMRKKIRSAFSEYLANEVLDEIINNPDRTRKPPQRAEICFILLQIRDDTAEKLPAHIGQAMDIVVQRGGTVCDVMSSVVLAIFGFPLSDDPERNRDQRSKSVTRLVTELGPNIRLVYGTAEGLVGNFGSPRRLHYGPLLPGFARYLSALTALEFGQATELRRAA